MNTEFPRFAQQVVVDIGDVTNTTRFVTQITQPSLENVVGHVGGCMPEVRRIVRSDAAGVHKDQWAGLKCNNFTTSGVVKAHRTGRSYQRHRSFSGSIPVNFTATRVLYLRLSSRSTAVNASIGAA